MRNHEINLARQHHDNRVYLRNLENFISSPRFSALPPDHQEAIVQQCSAMEHLDHALTLRMTLLNLPV